MLLLMMCIWFWVDFDVDKNLFFNFRIWKEILILNKILMSEKIVQVCRTDTDDLNFT